MLNLPSNRQDPVPERNIHATYRNKPKPDMQMISQSSQFQDNTRASLAYRSPDIVQTPAVPTTWDTVYDPDHPDADWSGLVSKDAIFTRKHDHNHPSHRENIERNELGIVSKTDSSEFSKRRVNSEGATRNTGSIIIGGIDNPEDRFKTTYKRFENQEKTDKEQMILEKRIHATRPVLDPSQSRGNSRHGIPNTQFDVYSNMKQDVNSGRGGSEPKFNQRASLLSNLGDILVTNSAIDAPPSKMNVNYKSEEYRTMMADNFKPFPGNFVNINFTCYSIRNFQCLLLFVLFLNRIHWQKTLKRKKELLPKVYSM